MKRLFISVICISILFMLAVVISAENLDENAVAVVDGHVITQADLWARVSSTQKKAIFEQLIYEELIRRKAIKEGIRITDDDIKKEIQRQVERYGFTSEEELLETIQLQYSLSKDELYDQTAIGLLLTTLRTRDIVVTDEEVKAYFEANKNAIVSVRASHILVDTEAEAKAVIKRLNNGESFEKIAKEKSIDTTSKTNGGDLGYFKKGEMVDEFEKAAFSLAVGEISAPIKTTYGYHIIKVTDKKDTLEDFKEEIISQIKDEKSMSVADYLKMLKNEADIKYLDPLYEIK